jgi:hypothetical protein
MRTLLRSLVLLAALALPAGALADRPVVTTEHVDYSVTIPADQNPCGFDLVFTGLGDVTVITFSDGRQFDQGILQHTISGPGGTLSSIGPASVHLDLTTGVSTDTGMEFSFHVPGHGIVFAQAGNFSFLPDGTVIEHGLDQFSPELCEVLA